MRHSSFSITMPHPMRAFVLERMRSGSWGNVSEYFRHLVRADQERVARERLESLLAEGLASGRSVKATPAFWEALKAEAIEQAKPAGARKSTTVAAVKRARRSA